MTNSRKNYFFTLLFFALCNGKALSQEMGNSVCMIFYDNSDRNKDTIKGVDLEVIKEDTLIFEWPNMVGPAYLFKKDSMVFIECTGAMISTVCDSLDFFKYRFATIVVDLRTCVIEKQLNSMDYLPETPESLCAMYQSNLFKYRAKKSVQKNCSMDNYVRLYACQLMYAALMGSTDAKCLFQNIKKDYRLFDLGLDAVEYRMNQKIIQQLSPINNAKCQN